MYLSLERYLTVLLLNFVAYTPCKNDLRYCKLKIEVFMFTDAPACMTAFKHCLFKYGFIQLINHTKYWIIKGKHPSLDKVRKIYHS